MAKTTPNSPNQTYKGGIKTTVRPYKKTKNTVNLSQDIDGYEIETTIEPQQNAEDIGVGRTPHME